MESVRITYSGRVQGVGFRATVADLAARFKVTGWVRNHLDGTVQLLAEGESQELVAFLTAIEERLARNITGCETQWLPTEQPAHPDFRIAPTTAN